MSLRRMPLQIKGLTLPSRLIMAPMASAKATEEGLVTDALIGFYRERTEDGALGLVVLEHAYILPQGQAKARQLSIAGEETVEGLKRLVEAIHGSGTPVFAQINYAGSFSDGEDRLSASAVANPRRKDGPVPSEMTKAEITAVTGAFAAAALRAKAAGFDGVEVHAAHGYLLSQFLSPLTNRRGDEYGGALAHRLRLHREVIQAVRQAVGTAYPLALRLGACDDLEGGLAEAEGVEAAAQLAAEGLDLLDISGGMSGYIRPGRREPGYYGEITAAIRRRTEVPVILTGGITSGEEAEALLAAGKADLIGVGRPFLKDAHWAKRALEGQVLS
ncbi:MAG: NADH:flavin oxidoreductase [Oscillospiraceae bacterium]|nr:NADH:flavin oxidoreductase [Oscillospiraceae bacterium]